MQTNKDVPQPPGGTPASREAASDSMPASSVQSSPSSNGRQLYASQFTETTQEILSQLRNQPRGGLSAALASAARKHQVSNANVRDTAEYGVAKKQLLMKLNGGNPPALPVANTTTTQSLSHSAQSQGRPSPRVMPMPDAFQLRRPAPIPNPSSIRMPEYKLQTPTANSNPAVSMSMPTARVGAPAATAYSPAQSVALSSTPAGKTKGKEVRGTKRKRGKNEETLPAADDTDSDFDPSSKTQTAPTMTKSGRQVQKPTQFNPSEAAGSKRKNYGKLTADQMLCKICTRGLSPIRNQIVFCDGCNSCFHQLCHDPYIDDDFVNDENLSWYCKGCVTKREKALAKKKTMIDFKGVSWANKSAQDKRKHLFNTTHTHLVNTIMYCLELHPDLPIFPTQQQGVGVGRQARGPTNFPGVDTPTASSSSIRQANGKTRGKARGSSVAQGQNQIDREESVDSVPPSWPKPGHGVLKNMELNEDDLRDNDDYEAFSVTTYDGKGKKVMENGMPV